MSEAAPAFWPSLIKRGLSALGLALPGFALNLWERSFDPETRFTPVFSQIQDLLYPLPLLSLVVALVFIIRHYSASTKSFSRLQRAAWIFVVLLAQLVFAFGALFAGVLTKHDWLFGPPEPYLSVRSPNGLRTAYATRNCNIFGFCSLDVHVQQGRAPTMQKTHHFPRWSHVRLVWRPDSSAVRVMHEKADASP